MTGPDQNFSRVNRKKGRNRANNILNILIAVVVVLIMITATTIFLGGDDSEEATEDNLPTTEETTEDTTEETTADTLEEVAVIDEEKDEGTVTEEVIEEDADQETDADSEADEESGVLTYVTSDDEVIAETIIDTAWEPIGTAQTGKHASLYDGKSVDWKEKQEAIAYATGLSTDSMIFWKIKNGGSPQKSIGIVSSKDKAEKYRVYLEWIDGKGWKPVKKDVLTTLDFNY